MPRYRCNSCQGVYSNPQADGSSYAHVCPEERVVELPGSTEEEPRVQLEAIADRRDERPRPAGRSGLVETDSLGNPRILSPGKGRTKLPEDVAGDVLDRG